MQNPSPLSILFFPILSELLLRKSCASSILTSTRLTGLVTFKKSDEATTLSFASRGSVAFLSVSFHKSLTSRNQNPDIPQAGQGGAAHGGQGSAAMGRTGRRTDGSARMQSSLKCVSGSTKQANLV